jgi:hypothetical protein
MPSKANRRVAYTIDRRVYFCALAGVIGHQQNGVPEKTCYFKAAVGIWTCRLTEKLLCPCLSQRGDTWAVKGRENRTVGDQVTQRIRDLKREGKDVLLSAAGSRISTPGIARAARRRFERVHEVYSCGRNS